MAGVHPYSEKALDAVATEGVETFLNRYGVDGRPAERTTESSMRTSVGGA